MFGVWNSIIKTPFLQFYTVITIMKDEKDGVKLVVETEPLLNLSFTDIRIEHNSLSATSTDANGQTQKLELHFDDSRLTGSLVYPFFGTVAFTGEKGRGISLKEKLQKYGDKSVQENRYWKAQWIWDAKQPEDSDKSNHQMVYFRRSFHVPNDIQPKLTIDITADSRYRLYINGNSVSTGPCKGDAHTYYYETVDVSGYLMPGENVIAVKVLRYPSLEPFKSGEGGPISVWRSQSAGLLVEANLCDENDVEMEALHSGPKWRTYRHQGYFHNAKSLIRWMGGTEEVKGDGAPQGWELPEFNDKGWPQALPFANTIGLAGILSPWPLTPRPIPFLFEEERSFLKTTRLEGLGEIQANEFLQGRNSIPLSANSKLIIELDAGELTTGYLSIGVRGGRGAIVKMLASECYEAQDSTETRRIKNNREDISGKLMGEFDVYHVSGQAEGNAEEIYEPFGFRTFRYVRIEIVTGAEPLEWSHLNYRETGYPLDVKTEFRCSDEGLNQIWDMSLRTLKRCMHETYEDCPYYEQLQYTMDSRLMMLFTYYVSADDRMPRRTIKDFYRSRLPSGMLQSRFPSIEPQVIPSFSLYWVDMLSEHYKFNGDKDLIKSYRPAMLELLDWFQERLTDEGIVGVTPNSYWSFFDWVDVWPLGAPPESIDRPMFLLSLMYAYTLRNAAELLLATGWKEAAMEMVTRADYVCHSVNKLAWSDEKQLFRELPDTEIYTQHTQIMAVLSGAIVGDEAKRLMKRALTENIHQVTLPFSYLLFQALKKTGLQSLAFDLWDRWRVFVDQGLTTMPEMEKNPRSDCHAWSAVALAEFPSSILGVSPAEPGFGEIRIDPQADKLQWARGRVATMRGEVEVEWRKEGTEFYIRAKLPNESVGRIKLPDGSEKTFKGEGQFSCAY